jgi:hypothetical protein
MKTLTTIGAEGWARSIKARDTGLGHDVAVKMLGIVAP